MEMMKIAALMAGGSFTNKMGNVATMEKMWKMGMGRKPRKDTDKIWEDGLGVDFHCWLEDENGKVIDRTPPAYPGKKHYKPFPKKDQTRIFIKMLNEGTIQKSKLMMDFFAKYPLARNCMNNSYAYKMLKYPHLKFIIGSLGFQMKKNNKKKIFWEFG
jgi:hypothetical protein